MSSSRQAVMERRGKLRMRSWHLLFHIESTLIRRCRADPSAVKPAPVAKPLLFNEVSPRIAAINKGLIMIRLKGPALFAMLAFALATAPAADAQGKGKGQGGGEADDRRRGQGGKVEKASSPGKAKGQGQAKGRDDAPKRSVERNRGRSDAARGVESDRGNAASRGGGGKGKFVRVATPGTMPQSVRRFANSRRAQDVIVAAAMSHAFARGRENDFRITQDGDGWRVLNLRGDPLVFLDESRARDLGRWRVGVLDDEVREGAPSFCRSGEGHPVWGRQWCLDKGFGLGDYNDFSWG